MENPDAQTWEAWADERWSDDPLAAHLLMVISRQVEVEEEDRDEADDPRGEYGIDGVDVDGSHGG